ncbi:uncharacterized protein LOC143447342 [Clavelina lepadiformis]|uniref:uncharacterized protein LOC143447342 n=1 Tax=Clavelina lepadiformis TaxID=159417 RepID=UPI0040416221
MKPQVDLLFLSPLDIKEQKITDLKTEGIDLFTTSESGWHATEIGSSQNNVIKQQASAQSSRHITQTCEHWYSEDEPGEYTEQKPKLNKTRFGTWRCDNKKFLENCNPHIENVKHLEQKQARVLSSSASDDISTFL